jgi:murein L,D-transpeptidase YafK
MKQTTALIFILFCALMVNGQNAASVFTFLDYQRSFPRFSEALKKKEDTLMKQFRQKKLEWPVRNMYIRSFKYDSQLEVWVKYENNERYKLFKTYKVCALAGSLGPKRMQGDYQVPEGFYYINEFNPRSAYHLSLGLNYPNASDRMLGDSLQPGGDIYIHGKCVTSGCIPIMDQQIEELYILAAHAHSQGQDFIPVHIFPVDFKNERSNAYLAKYLKQFPEYIKLSNELKQAYNYFEKTKKLPLILIGDKGQYIVDNDVDEKDIEPEPTPAVVEKPRPKAREFKEEELAKVVDKLPVYPGGNAGFQTFLDRVALEMSRYVSREMKKTYVMVEFIIDENGKPAYAQVIRGGNDELNEKLQGIFEHMPTWEPATRGGKNVAIKLKQSIEITR